MAHEDFSMKHYEQLLKEKREWIEEKKHLINQINQKDDVAMEKDNLIYNQNMRLKNYDDTASKVQENGGRIVGLMNKIIPNK